MGKNEIQTHGHSHVHSSQKNIHIDQTQGGKFFFGVVEFVTFRCLVLILGKEKIDHPISSRGCNDEWDHNSQNTSFL